MPSQLAVFPKCFLDDLVVHRTMTVFQWIEMAATLPHVTGLELYPPALPSLEPATLRSIRQAAADHGLSCPMMCASPDFIHPEAAVRRQRVQEYLPLLDAVAELGGISCRVLSGQRLPEVCRADGIAWTVECITALLPAARERGLTLVLENHYKDGYWQYPEFAGPADIFLEIVSRIAEPGFGVNYDPSNALIWGDDPLAVLRQVRHRVISMHASDRHLQGGTLEDLRRLEGDPVTGYAGVIQHGVVGEGLNDYDTIFSLLREVGFDGWISIEDGQDRDQGMDHLRRSAEFLWERMQAHHLA